jgi:hypothetical protein
MHSGSNRMELDLTPLQRSWKSCTPGFSIAVSNHSPQQFHCRFSWPSCSPDLNPCGYFLWGYLKNEVSSSAPRTLPELKERIKEICVQVTRGMLTHVVQNFLLRLQAVQQFQGAHMEHVIHNATHMWNYNPCLLLWHCLHINLLLPMHCQVESDSNWLKHPVWFPYLFNVISAVWQLYDSRFLCTVNWHLGPWGTQNFKEHIWQIVIGLENILSSWFVPHLASIMNPLCAT